MNGPYPRVRIEGGSWAVVSQAGGVLLAETVRKADLETLALPATVDILTQYGTAPLRIGCIFTRDRTWAFMLSLSKDASVVLACTGVRQVDP